MSEKTVERSSLSVRSLIPINRLSITNWALIVLAAVACFLAVLGEREANAANGRLSSQGGHSYDGERSSYRQEMLVDFSAHYVRDTKPDGATDTAGRFSLGGMFNDYIGLDLQGLYEVKSKDYLVGGDLRLAPVNWFFLKGGMGAYADKRSRQFRVTPIAGAGILARLTRDYYLVTEASYFQVNDRNNISFGAGMGISF